ncbi:MAG: hypothetical protein MUC69_00340 [Gemmatimonadales bacterium]|jgi:hypothetical protein|nr:hypothetical protein [Gemmatimonadales bacterium]
MPRDNHGIRPSRLGTCGVLVLGLALAIGGCASSTGTGQVDAGTQVDSSTPPVDGGGGDVAVPDGGGGDGGAGIAGHRGTAIMAGAVDAKSSRYRAVMSTGQSPGGNTTAASSTYKVRGGLVGATQGR